MTNRTLELIEQFNPKPVVIPINRCELEEVIESLIRLMFPVCEDPATLNLKEELTATAVKLRKNIENRTNKQSADQILESFFEEFSTIQQRLYEDAHCYLKYDPAAKTLEEVVLAYPGFYALCVHRLAHSFHNLGVPLIARLFSEYAHSKVGIDIHPGAIIGDNFFMDHGTGIVIGETTIIGNNVKIYQGVTLGALYIEKKLSNIKRHPTVEDNVVIYANATILGGQTIIGHDSTIAGGSWLTHSIIPYSLVYNSVDVKIRTVKNFDHPHDFVI